MEVVTLILLFKLAFAMDGQNIVLDRDVHVLRFHPRKFCFDDQLVLVFVDIYAWVPSTAKQFIVAGTLESKIKCAIYLVLQAPSFAKRVVSDQIHFSTLLNVKSLVCYLANYLATKHNKI